MRPRLKTERAGPLGPATMGAKRIDTAGADKSAGRVASIGHRPPPARTVMRCLLKQVLELEPVHGGGEKMALANRAAERLRAMQAGRPSPHPR